MKINPYWHLFLWHKFFLLFKRFDKKFTFKYTFYNYPRIILEIFWMIIKTFLFVVDGLFFLLEMMVKVEALHFYRRSKVIRTRLDNWPQLNRCQELFFVMETNKIQANRTIVSNYRTACKLNSRHVVFHLNHYVSHDWGISNYRLLYWGIVYTRLSLLIILFP